MGFRLSELRRNPKIIEKSFKPGMSWDNYGEWEIDHIIPLSKGGEHNVNNLQALWKSENRIKKEDAVFIMSPVPKEQYGIPDLEEIVLNLKISPDIINRDLPIRIINRADSSKALNCLMQMYVIYAPETVVQSIIKYDRGST